MSTPQQPIASGFGFETSVDEVLAGLDLSGKLAVVTGGYSGIGIEDVRAFSAAGAAVIVPARRPDQARAALSGVERVKVDELDLANLESVRAFAERFLASDRPIDILHKASPIQWDDLQFERGYDKWRAYGQSKTANVLFAVELDRLAESAGVRAFAVYPGAIKTPLQRHLSDEERTGNPLVRWKTPQQGAATSAWGATSPQLEGLGGVYLENCEVAEIADPATEEGQRGGVNPWAIDSDQARRLWAVSAELTGVDAFSSAAA